MRPEDLSVFMNLGADFLLGQVIRCESRGEPIEGQIAVGCSVRNRFEYPKQPFGKTYKEILLARLQFSCLNTIEDGSGIKQDPNYDWISRTARLAVQGLTIEDLTGLFKQARAIAACVINDLFLDNTKGATHYHKYTYHPWWADAPTMHFIMRIGDHLFYREER